MDISSKNPKYRRLFGEQQEARACLYLEQQGLSCLMKNFSSHMGEIDLIMRENTDIIFVEVRYKNNQTQGSAIESVHKIKQQRIIKTALFYLQKKGWVDKYSCRFDVIGIDKKNETTCLTWIKNAFQAG